MGALEQELVSYAAQKGAMLDKEALALILQNDNPMQLIDELSRENIFLSPKLVEEYLLKSETKLGDMEVSPALPPSPLPLHSSENFRILNELDVTGKSYSEGKVGDFVRFFQDKFLFIESELKQRVNFQPKQIENISRAPKGREVQFVAMLQDKKLSKNNHWILNLEDMHSAVTVLALANDPNVHEFAATLIPDEVVGVKAVKGNGDLLIVKELFRPEMPQRMAKACAADANLAVLSDLHVGSKLFFEKEFSNFISWFNGQYGSEADQELAEKTKYVIIAGDNIAGLGVYPGQFEDLAIKDVYEQYKALEEFLLQIPSSIHVFVCPGQHDAVRWADPQPAISKEFVPRLYERENFHLIGSPSWIEIEGLKVLVYHGGALHDFYNQVAGFTPSKPQEVAVELLKRRDLACGFGIKQPYVPEKKNYMLVRELPDLYIGGDQHHVGYAQYRGCTILNGATFEGITKYQIERGIKATPCIVPVINLKSRQISEMHYLQEEKQ
ncbi:MAG: metallophosphoesterase [Candidatus Diapherotrites archaeon]